MSRVAYVRLHPQTHPPLDDPLHPPPTQTRPDAETELSSRGATARKRGVCAPRRRRPPARARCGDGRCGASTMWRLYSSTLSLPKPSLGQCSGEGPQHVNIHRCTYGLIYECSYTHEHLRTYMHGDGDKHKTCTQTFPLCRRGRWRGPWLWRRPLGIVLRRLRRLLPTVPKLSVHGMASVENRCNLQSAPCAWIVPSSRHTAKEVKRPEHPQTRESQSPQHGVPRSISCRAFVRGARRGISEGPHLRTNIPQRTRRRSSVQHVRAQPLNIPAVGCVNAKVHTWADVRRKRAKGVDVWRCSCTALA